MEYLNIHLQPFFEWLLRTTVQASLLICLILLLQMVLRGKLGPRWCHALWLLLLIRMAMPWAPQSRASVFNLIPQPVPHGRTEYARTEVSADTVESDVAEKASSESKPISKADAQKETAESIAVTPVVREGVGSQSKSTFLEVADVLPLVWLAGALVLAVYVCAGNFHLWWLVTRERPLTNQGILDLLEDCKSQMGIRTIMGVVITDKVKSPALFGFIRPRLLLPAGMIETLSREELRYVFLHELAHLKRHDIYLGYLSSLLQVLHWFNPLIWLAFYRMRADRELACDALVLARLTSGGLARTQSSQARDYGRTIVGLLERFARPRRLPAMAGILETKAQLRRRITMIARFKKNSYQWSPLAVTLIIVLACISLPDALGGKGLVSSTAKHAPETVLRRVILKKLNWPISPPSLDGKYICGVDWSTGNLAVHELTTGDEREVTNKKGAWDDSTDFAFWSLISPESTKVAYLWYNSNRDAFDLCLIGIDGSDPQVLHRFEKKDSYAFLPIGWSSDSTEILGAFSRKGELTQIISVSTADGSVRTATTLGQEVNLFAPESFRGDRTAKFNLSPDRRYLAYEAPQQKGSPKFDIFVSALDQKHEVCLVSHAANDMLMGWTPDGRHIVFASDRTGTRDAWSLRVVDGKPEGLPERVKSQIGNIEPLGFAPDGSYYYGLTDETWNVYVVKLDPETGKVLPPPRAVRHTGNEGLPDWSPDGKYLAYCTRPGGEKSQIIHIRSMETGQERQLDAKLPHFRWLRWSPDGRSILVTDFVQKLRDIIYKIDVLTGERTMLLRTKTSNILHAALSPDGKTLFYSDCDRPTGTTRSRLMVRDLQTGREKQLVRVVYGTAPYSRWALSPDGKQLAFVLQSNASRSVNTVPTTGGKPNELLNKKLAEELRFRVAWTPDGQYILFFLGDELWRISAEGGEPQKLWEWKEKFSDLRVHPDGQHIAFATRGYMYEVWVMENFLPADVASAAGKGK